MTSNLGYDCTRNIYGLIHSTLHHSYRRAVKNTVLIILRLGLLDLNVNFNFNFNITSPIVFRSQNPSQLHLNPTQPITMSTPQGTLLVIGSGPGIGVSTASLFATHGFKHIILTSRNAERLTQEAETVKKAAGAQGEIRVDTLTLDLAGSKDSLNETFGKVDGLLKESGSELEVVLYNGARVGPSVIGEWDVSGLEEDLRVSSSLFLF